jgi:two-component system cell cycle sensor histidine kinase/response regulator CckA
MGGEQALEAMRRVRPDVRVILMSGYSEEDVATRFAAAGRPNEFLEKPFRWADLSDKLRAVLA